MDISDVVDRVKARHVERRTTNRARTNFVDVSTLNPNHLVNSESTIGHREIIRIRNALPAPRRVRINSRIDFGRSVRSVAHREKIEIRNESVDRRVDAPSSKVLERITPVHRITDLGIRLEESPLDTGAARQGQQRLAFRIPDRRVLRTQLHQGIVDRREMRPTQGGGGQMPSKTGESRSRITSRIQGAGGQGGNLGIAHGRILDTIPIRSSDGSKLAKIGLEVGHGLCRLPFELKISQANDRRLPRINFELKASINVPGLNQRCVNVARRRRSSVGKTEVGQTVRVGRWQLARGSNNLGDKAVLGVEFPAGEQRDVGINTPRPVVDWFREEILRLNEELIDVGKIGSTHGEKRFRIEVCPMIGRLETEGLSVRETLTRIRLRKPQGAFLSALRSGRQILPSC
jgi:hypothetical protein